MLAAGLVVAVRPQLALTASLVFCAVVVLAWVPLDRLLSLGLIGVVLVPVKWLPGMAGAGTANLGLLVLIVWVARVTVTRADGVASRPKASPAVLVVLLSTWLLVACIGSIERYSSLLWVLSFCGLVMAPVLGGARDRRGLERALRTWVALASLCGGFAAIEAFVLHRNPLFDWAYHSGSSPLVQVWDVYRATSTLGHPLTNAVFFATAIPIALGFVGGPHGRRYLVAIAPCAVGLLATASRGAAAGAGVGIVVAVLMAALSRQDRYRSFLRAGIALVMLGALAVIGSGALSERSSSQEATGSASYRSLAFGAGRSLAARSPLTGFGPGVADQAKRQFVSAGDPKAGLEDSWMQIVVGGGLPALALTAALVALACSMAAKARNWGLLGALIAYLIAAATSALVEQQQPYLLFFGILLASSIWLGDRAPPDPDPGLDVYVADRASPTRGPAATVSVGGTV